MKLDNTNKQKKTNFNLMVLSRSANEYVKNNLNNLETKMFLLQNAKLLGGPSDSGNMYKSLHTHKAAAEPYYD